MQGLAWVGQDDFAAGMLRAVGRGVDQGVGLQTAVNGLFDDDGDVYRRGGTSYASDAADGPITFVWSGYLNGIARALVATATRTYSLAAGVLTEIAATGIPRPVLQAVVGERLWLPNGKSWDGGAALANWTAHAHVAAIADRLVVADGNRIAFSNAGDPTIFTPDDFHELPDGVLVVGMLAIRDTLLVFTNYGLWAISNMAFDLTDAQGNAQQTLSRLTPELSLVHEAGLCEWAGVIVAPCIDRIYLVDGQSSPVAVSDSIAPVYMGHIRAGHKPGGAKVFRNHLFLPMLDGTMVSDVLVCRLNRPVKGRFTYYPWSQLRGFGGQQLAFDVSLLDPAPHFWGAGHGGRLIELTNVFNPSDGNEVDADGSAHVFELETRDYPTGNGQPNHVRRMRLYYTLRGAGTIEAGYSYGSTAQDYEQLRGSVADYAAADAAYVDYARLLRGGVTSAFISPEDPARFWNGLAPITTDSPGIDPFAWWLPQAERVRFIRARFRCSDPVERLTIHRFEIGVRSAAHTR